MAKVTGTLTGNVSMASPRSLGVTMPENCYPDGAVTFTNIKSGGAYWHNNNNSQARSAAVYLCDKNGNNRTKLFDVSLTAGGNNITTKSATISGATALAGKALYVYSTSSQASDIIFRGTSPVQVNYSTLDHSIFCYTGNNGGGTLSASRSSAAAGTTITLYPNPNTGWMLDYYETVPSGTAISGNQFTMPNENISITAHFKRVNYVITRAVNPEGAGTVTAPAYAQSGNGVDISQSPNTGYYFSGWTSSPAVTITNNHFTMPTSAITITANYKKRSTAGLSSADLTGGESAVLTIYPDKATYSHQYKLDFGVTGMATDWVSVAAGTTSVSVSIPEAWCSLIPNAGSQTGGSMTVKTYDGETEIGSYTISGLTFYVPAGAVPEVGTITAGIARTIGGVTYANIGDYFVQNHCGVRVQASPAGVYSSTIASVQVSLSGYSGSSYSHLASGGSLDFTTGLLNIAGEITVTVTATDSRGRTGTATATITVVPYTAPGGSLTVWRVDVNGDADDMGGYGKFSQASQFTSVGSNSLTVTLSCDGSTVTPSTATGDLMPDTRKSFSLQQEYTVTLTLTDAFETTVITARLPSAKFIIYVNADGDRLGFMKATTHSVPSGKTSVVEFSGDSQIYIGNYTLEEYIALIAGS